MKSLKVPHVFAPQSGLSAEDLNKNFHHLLRQYENINEKRYGYSNLRIPFSVFSSEQKIGFNPAIPGSNAAPGGSAGLDRPGGIPFWNPRRLLSKNHEALRTFSFSPPYDVRVTRMEVLVISSGTNTVELSFVVDPGGEGYPPRPESVLPVGFNTDRNPDTDKLHRITSFPVEESGVNETVIVTSNQEYLLKGGKCYRIQISSPRANTYFKKAYADITFQYDRFQGKDPDIPNIDFVNSADTVSKDVLEANLTAIYNDLYEELNKTRTMKSELYYFGLGKMNGNWKRPPVPAGVTGATAYQSTMQSYVDITAGPDSTNSVWDDNETLKFISDFEQFYFNASGYDWDKINNRTLITEMAFDFFSHSLFRAPMAPAIEQLNAVSQSEQQDVLSNLQATNGLNGKVVLGYTLGLLHNSTYHHCMFSEEENGFHYGLDYTASIGHGIQNGNSMSMKPHFWSVPQNITSTVPAPVQVTRSSEYVPDENFIAPRLNNLATDPPSVPSGWEGGPDITQQWAKTDTPLGSTQIPSCVNRADLLNTTGFVAADELTALTGKATGFPGDYLAEIHGKTPVDITSYSSYGTGSNYTTGSLSTGVGNFAKERSPHNPYLSTIKENNVLIDLFIQIMTQLPNSGRSHGAPPTARDASMMYRHLQKMYLVLWVG